MITNNLESTLNDNRLSGSGSGRDIGKKNLLARNLILIALVVIISVAPLIFVKNAEFGGADGEAEGIIEKINPEYKPWFNSIFEPASGEIESLLFSIQAAIGAGIICYYIGYNVGRKKAVREE